MVTSLTFADLLMQRFKALEPAVDQKNWTPAGHLEMELASDGLASLAEKEAAAHTLNEAVKRKVGTKSHYDGGRDDGSRSLLS